MTSTTGPKTTAEQSKARISPRGIYATFWKRILDVILSLLGLAVLIIPFLIIAFLIRLDSPGKAIFLQKRSGKGRIPFQIFKFRTMPANTPKYVATNDMEYDKLNCTKLQSFLRKNSIDELPQLFNILKGDMSVIGPRPVICEEEVLLDERDRYGANDIKPGLTGWAQINGRDCVEIKDKARLDGEYARKLSFIFDVKCFLLSIVSVLRHEGYNENFKRK